MATARVANDAYYTDPALALEICKRLQPVLVLEDTPRILEPSAGDGAFCKGARTIWGPDARIIAVEPYLPVLVNDKGVPYRMRKKEVERWGVTTLHEQTIEKFVSFSPADFDLTLGNPPFNQAEEHLALVRPISRYVAFLLRLGFLGSQGRAERVFSKPGLRYLMNIAQRPSFVHDATDKYDYGVFVWQRSYTGLAEILPPLWVTR